MQRSQNNSQWILRNCSVKNKFSLLSLLLLSLSLSCSLCLSLLYIICKCVDCVLCETWKLNIPGWPAASFSLPRVRGREGEAWRCLHWSLELEQLMAKVQRFCCCCCCFGIRNASKLWLGKKRAESRGGGKGAGVQGVEGVWFWFERRQSAECSWNSNSSGKVDIEMVTGYRESSKMGTETDRQKRRRKEGVSGGRKRF